MQTFLWCNLLAKRGGGEGAGSKTVSHFLTAKVTVLESLRFQWTDGCVKVQPQISSPVSSPRFSASLWNWTVFYICRSTLLCSQRAMIGIRKNGGVLNNKIYRASVAVQLLDIFFFLGGGSLGDRLSRLVTFIHFKIQRKYSRRTSVDIKVLEVPILFLMSIWSCGGQGE